MQTKIFGSLSHARYAIKMRITNLKNKEKDLKENI